VKEREGWKKAEEGGGTERGRDRRDGGREGGETRTDRKERRTEPHPARQPLAMHMRRRHDFCDAHSAKVPRNKASTVFALPPEGPPAQELAQIREHDLYI